MAWSISLWKWYIDSSAQPAPILNSNADDVTWRARAALK